MSRRHAIPSILLCLLVPAACCRSFGQVYVRKRADHKSVLDLGGFATGSGAGSAVFTQTLRSDLARSGWFVFGGPEKDFVLSGVCKQGRKGLVVECRVVQPAERRECMSKRYRDRPEHARRLAHVVADAIVTAVTGEKGIASTRIAMVAKVGGRRDIYVCDADGQNLVQLTHDNAICLAPRWSPDARRIVYTSLHAFFPDLFIIDVARGVRKPLSTAPGLNAGGAISPDGRAVAMILSKDGNPELYVKSLGDGRLTRLTRTRHAAEASPAWAPDGRRLVYVSDSAGAPQLYVCRRDGTGRFRLTARGTENVDPDWGPKGRIAYSSRRAGRYHICTIDPETRQDAQHTAEPVDHEDPSWAPDGRHIIFTRRQNHRGALYVLDMLGEPTVRLSPTRGEFFSPAWSPK